MAAQFLTPAQLAERWAMSARHVERLCSSGRLQASRLAGWRIALSDAIAYEQRQANGPAEQPTPRAEPIRPVFGTLEDDGPRVLGPRWWETDDVAASSAAGRRRSPGKRKRPRAITQSR